MEYKLFNTPEVKLKDDGSGVLVGYASTFANWDDVRERPAKGAFTRHLSDFLKDGFIALGHSWTALPIATPTEAREDDYGLFVSGDFHSHADAQDARTVIKERLERNKSVKLSIGYEVLDDEYTQEGRILKEIKLYEWSYVTVPANPLASVTDAKSGLPLDQEHQAVLAAVAAYTRRLADLKSLRAKEGRVLSGENRKRIETAVDALDGARVALHDLLTETDPQKSQDAERLYLESLRLQSRFRQAGVTV